MAVLQNPHGRFFQQFLAKSEIAEDFLRNHLPAEVLEMLALATLELQNDTFIDAELREHFSDLLYLVTTQSGKPIAISLLFEHKSYPEPFVAFQLLRYMVRNWESRVTKRFSATAKWPGDVGNCLALYSQRGPGADA